jgi:hypothetical protein
LSRVVRTRRGRLQRLLLATAVLLVGWGGGILQSGHAQPDSTRAAILEAKGYAPDHSPREALWRAAVAPSWGQLYNQQYYKLPFVYGGLAGLGYTVFRMNRQYFLYRRAHLFTIGQQRVDNGEVSTNPYRQYQRQYNEVTAEVGGALSGRQLRRERDRYRRWRDLSIVGTGVFYVLTVLDAYVSAHLLTFNVGEALGVRVRPTGGVPPQATRGGPASADPLSSNSPLKRGAGISVRVRF